MQVVCLLLECKIVWFESGLMWVWRLCCDFWNFCQSLPDHTEWNRLDFSLVDVASWFFDTGEMSCFVSCLAFPFSDPCRMFFHHMQRVRWYKWCKWCSCVGGFFIRFPFSGWLQCAVCRFFFHYWHRLDAGMCHVWCCLFLIWQLCVVFVVQLVLRSLFLLVLLSSS